MENEIVLFRPYHRDDVGSLAVLTSQLGYTTSLEDMQSRMESIEPLNDYKTIVAVLGKRVVGYIALHKGFFWEQNGCFIRIQALVVLNSHREKGIGRGLIKQAEIWAHEMEAQSILLNCGARPERDTAHQFYYSVGFQKKSVGYCKQII